jgi:hypothetical protein
MMQLAIRRLHSDHRSCSYSFLKRSLPKLAKEYRSSQLGFLDVLTQGRGESIQLSKIEAAVDAVIFPESPFRPVVAADP